MVQSCLEFVSMDARHEQEARSDYQRDNQYSALHPDAMAASGNGKGVGGGHSHWLPNCRGTIGIINYSNFITDINSGAGNDCDNIARNKALARSLYNGNNIYSQLSVDTKGNVREGQFVNVYTPKQKRVRYV